MHRLFPNVAPSPARTWIWTAGILAALSLVIGFSTGVGHAVAILSQAHGFRETVAVVPLILVVVFATTFMTLAWISNAIDIFNEEIDLLRQDIRRFFVLLIVIGAGYVASLTLIIIAIHDAHRAHALAQVLGSAGLAFCLLCLVNAAINAMLALRQKNLTREWPCVPWDNFTGSRRMSTRGRAARRRLSRHLI